MKPTQSTSIVWTPWADRRCWWPSTMRIWKWSSCWFITMWTPKMHFCMPFPRSLSRPSKCCSITRMGIVTKKDIMWVLHGNLLQENCARVSFQTCRVQMIIVSPKCVFELLPTNCYANSVFNLQFALARSLARQRNRLIYLRCARERATHRRRLYLAKHLFVFVRPFGLSSAVGFTWKWT